MGVRQDAMDVYHKAAPKRARMAAVHGIGDIFASPQAEGA